MRNIIVQVGASPAVVFLKKKRKEIVGFYGHGAAAVHAKGLAVLAQGGGGVIPDDNAAGFLGSSDFMVMNGLLLLRNSFSRNTAPGLRIRTASLNSELRQGR